MRPTFAAAVLAFFLTLCAGAAYAADIDDDDTLNWDGMPLKRACEKNQLTVNQCAFEVWQRADAGMNSLYQTQIAYLAESQLEFKTDGLAKRQLIAAQRAWLTFRDRDCDYLVGEPGSSGMFERYKCMYKRTITRTNELREYVACRVNGCPY